jgi:hypothetical protein
MAHYSYKHVCYDIDYEKWKELEKRFEEENGEPPDGDPSYLGDNWYLAEMWIRELIEENKKLKEK